MCSSAQDRIQTIYLCRSPQVSMFVFLYLEGGTRPRAIARIEWGEGLVLFVEFPELPWNALQERVRQDMEAFSAQYGALITRIQIPEGCSPERLMEWIRVGSQDRGSLRASRVGTA